ncbi:hypothetical protein GMDG_00647 [Pseudogymnoascus destructans 20631-21]|uniref:Uncharacterized protein n=1 Tax=Pseudogymnoascus destructans (strain ATCC MYA-4855 / 20631-21) TaxID=658429 RepID=L8G834_PSED2|nr:hypothetical protein GMDG_00647 [Pseudogymnoascus destructans 20631-21]
MGCLLWHDRAHRRQPPRGRLPRNRRRNPTHPPSISLLRRGRPFTLRDETINTDWTIHPFAFLLASPSTPITIDFEHTEYTFVTPSQLSEYDTVPALADTTLRVLPGAEVEDALRTLRMDHTSGATALATLALLTLRRALLPPLSTAPTTAVQWRATRLLAWTLAKSARPAMAPAIEASIFEALERIALSIGGVGKSDDFEMALEALSIEVFREVATKAIEDVMEAREDAVVKLASNFTACVQHSPGYQAAFTEERPVTLVILSASASVAACVADLARAAAATKMKVRALVLESRPRFEGVEIARAVLDLVVKVEVQILTDAGVGRAVGEADFVVLGADRVTGEGDVSNKTGSLAAAGLAPTVGNGCKVVVVCCEEKIMGDDGGGEGLAETDGGEENEASEVTAAWPARAKEVGELEGVKVRNPYFEWVPSRFVDVYVTEAGEVGVEGLKKVARERGELEEWLFDGL